MDAIAPQERLYSVNQLAQELGVTPRALRFYETKGLITPRRAGGNRVFDRRDRARLLLILRGKRLGFSLDEIGEYLDLYHTAHDQAGQIRLLLGRVRDRLAMLRAQAYDLDLTIGELCNIEAQALRALADHPAGE